MSIPCWALLVVPLLAGACVTSRGLTPRPGARLEARGSGVTARVKRVHLKWGHYKDQGPDQVVIIVANGNRHKVRLKPRRIRLVELRPRAADEVPRAESGSHSGVRSGAHPWARQGQGPSVPRVNPGTMAIHSGVAGARVGGSLSGGGGSGLGRVAGGVGGGMLGAAAAVAIMIPVGGYLLVDHLIRMTDRTIAPGKERALRISLGHVALDARKRYALDLGAALEPPAPQMEPLPLVDVTDAYLGYDPPSTLRWIWLMRMGGGALWEGPTTGGLGGVELLFGRQWGGFALAGFATLGAGAAGLEARYQLRVLRWLTLVPFASYGYTYLAGQFGWAVGHGPRGGLELDFPLDRQRRFNYERSGTSIGLYAHVGPLFIHEREEPGVTAQFGLVVGGF